MAVPIDGTCTVSVAPVMASPVLGMQEPPHQVGKRFPDWRQPGGLPRRRGLGGLDVADGDDLIPGPNFDGEGAEVRSAERRRGPCRAAERVE